MLGIALVRFGCCDRDQGADLAQRLLERGRVETPSGHTVRMVSFGFVAETDQTSREWHAVSMRHVVGLLRGYLRDHWEVLRHAQVKDPTLVVLALLEKWGADTPNA